MCYYAFPGLEVLKLQHASESWEILLKKKNRHSKKQIAGLQSETTGMGQIQEFSFLTFFPNDTDTCWSGTYTLRTTGGGNQKT